VGEDRLRYEDEHSSQHEKNSNDYHEQPGIDARYHRLVHESLSFLWLADHGPNIAGEGKSVALQLFAEEAAMLTA
jgi:hypothetical protein